MRFFLPVLLYLLSSSFSAAAQRDSTAYEGRTPDGIYLSYDDFRKNKSIGKEQSQSSYSKDQLDFISKVLAAEKFSYTLNGTQQQGDSKHVYGFFQNGTFYINFNGEFYRVPVFGSICYLVASVRVVNSGFYDPRFGMPVGPVVSVETREFLMNFYDGRLTEFTMERAGELLAHDAELYAEFKKLSRRKEKEQVYRYIRRYNERHPVYFLQDN